MRFDNQSVTPTLTEVLQVAIDANLANVNVCLPGRIEKYDSDTQYADVQPLLNRILESGQTFPWPVIPNIPVKHPRSNGGDAYVHMPLVKGDDVLIIVSQRSLDIWKLQGGMTEQTDRRRFNITDAYALIGGSAIPDAFNVVNPTAIEIVNGSTRLSVQTGGKYLISGGNNLGAQDDLISALNQLITVLKSGVCAAPGSPVVWATDPLFAAITTRISNFGGS